jgi:hypothetical protein
MKGLLVGLLCLALAACAAPTVTATPTPTSSTVTQLVCGRLAHADCLLIEAMVQHQLPFTANATALVMDYTCQPGQHCEVRFDAVVSILIPRDPAMDYAYRPPTYLVSGISGPETLGPWVGPLPATLNTLLLSAGFSG